METILELVELINEEVEIKLNFTEKDVPSKYHHFVEIASIEKFLQTSNWLYSHKNTAHEEDGNGFSVELHTIDISFISSEDGTNFLFEGEYKYYTSEEPNNMLSITIQFQILDIGLSQALENFQGRIM